MNNPKPSKAWGKITYQSPNFNGYTVWDISVIQSHTLQWMQLLIHAGTQKWLSYSFVQEGNNKHDFSPQFGVIYMNFTSWGSICNRHRGSCNIFVHPIGLTFMTNRNYNHPEFSILKQNKLLRANRNSLFYQVLDAGMFKMIIIWYI